MLYKRLPVLALSALLIAPLCVGGAQAGTGSSLQALVPQVPGWKPTEAPRSYLPATLYEYIDGGAESYISYGFRELVVAEFKSESSAASMTIEIYDMGSARHAFGIYSSEKFPGCTLVPFGTQGYLEEGTLNFIAGQDYVKLISFEGGSSADAALKSYAGEIAGRIKGPGALPPELSLFPAVGLVQGSEKFIQQNALGYGFLHDGFLASYKSGGSEFESFIIAGKDTAEAESMKDQYLAAEAKNQAPVERTDLGYRVKDRYAQNVFLSAAGRYLVGVMRLKDGAEPVGERYLEALKTAVARHP